MNTSEIDAALKNILKTNDAMLTCLQEMTITPAILQCMSSYVESAKKLADWIKAHDD